MKKFDILDTIQAVVSALLGYPILFFALFWTEYVEHTWWKLFGKHDICGKELEYNKKIEVICKAFDEMYITQSKTMLQDDSNLMLKIDIPYSLVKQTLNVQFDIVGFSKAERRRAMKEVNRANAINGPEYEFAIGGRSECFLLQTRLRESKYMPDEEPYFFWG